MDLGTHDEEPVDYPDFARAIGKVLQEEKAERGILICGSGVGACVAANKMANVRAGLCHDTYSAHQGVEHDDINVLCLGRPGYRRGTCQGTGLSVSCSQFYRRRATPKKVR